MNRLIILLVALAGCDRILGLAEQAPAPSDSAVRLPCSGDNFDAGTLDQTYWRPYTDSGTMLQQTAGRLEIVLPINDPHAYAGITSLAPLGQASVQVELVQPVLVDGAEASLQLTYGNDHAAISEGSGTIGVYILINGAVTVSASRSFDAVRDRFLRIDNVPPNLVFSTSEDNQTWTALVTAPPPSTTEAPVPVVFAGVYATMTTNVAVAFDNYEIVTPDCQP